jgi:hypothetical protein
VVTNYYTSTALSFTWKDTVYMPVLLDRGGISLGNNQLNKQFAKCLTRSVGAMQLFGWTSYLPVQGGYTTVSYTAVRLPGSAKLVEIEDNRLHPMHKKLPDTLMRCPTLVEKLSNKDPGFWYEYNKPTLNPFKLFKQAANFEKYSKNALQVWKRLVETYNACELELKPIKEGVEN